MKETTITRDEFEKAYAERSGVTIEWLRAHGEVAIPCQCEYERCEGWQMVVATIGGMDLVRVYQMPDQTWGASAGCTISDGFATEGAARHWAWERVGQDTEERQCLT